MLPTIIYRHKKENLKKCSLKGLETRQDMQFFTYPKDVIGDLSSYILLTLDAPPLTREDAQYGIFLIDGTWKHAAVMYRQLKTPHTFITRSLPKELKTAYPRRQDDCLDPERGLASIEALFAAYHILGRNTTGLLDGYYWKDAFLQKNYDLIQ